MRRVVRRTDIVVTVQTWAVTWVEDVPASEPAPAELLPAQPPDAQPEAPQATPETLRPAAAPDGDAH